MPQLIPKQQINSNCLDIPQYRNTYISLSVDQTIDRLKSICFDLFRVKIVY